MTVFSSTPEPEEHIEISREFKERVVGPILKVKETRARYMLTGTCSFLI